MSVPAARESQEGDSRNLAITYSCWSVVIKILGEDLWHMQMNEPFICLHGHTYLEASDSLNCITYNHSGGKLHASLHISICHMLQLIFISSATAMYSTPYLLGQIIIIKQDPLN